MTGIEWTEQTWNPTTGCDRVSPGCDHCYALTMAKRLKGMGNPKYQTDGDPRTSGPGFGLTMHPDVLEAPYGWKKPRRVFVNSMSDLFHDAVSDEFIIEVFARMWWNPRHTFQVLTKRHGRLRSLVPRIEADLRERERDLALVDSPAPLTWPLPNVWLGVSVEDQKWADIRIPALLETPAAVRFLSLEPLLGPVDISRYLWLTGPTTAGPFRDYAGRRRPGLGGGAGGMTFTNIPAGDLHWAIVGGESGPGARAMDPAWAEQIRDQCVGAGVPFFFKQWGAWVAPDHMTDATFMSWDVEHGSSAYDRAMPWRVGKKRAGRLLDGRLWDEYPAGVA